MPMRRVIDELTPLARKWQQGSVEMRKRIRDALRRAVKKLGIESRKRAPIKTGALEKAHAVRTRENPYGVRAEVIVMEERVNSRRPGAFLRFIHDGKYNLGKRSEAKQVGQQEIVQREFMDRALEDHQDEILAEIEDLFFKGVAGE